VAGAGRSRFAPGTIGAIVAVPIAWLVRNETLVERLAIAGVLTVLAVAASSAYLRERTCRSTSDDPREIVVDETVGCLIALVCVPFEAPWLIAAFAVFRFFDIFKPGPIRWVEQRLHGGVGVVMDDVAAGAAAGLLVAGSRVIVG
jgi:phosphatidylglycerophosphatase A